MTTNNSSDESKTRIAEARDEALGARDGKSKAEAIVSVNSGDVETQSPDGAEKKYYSKLSVWLMVLFSGLAIGSDG